MSRQETIVQATLIVVAAALSAALGLTSARTLPPDRATGGALFATYCASCHGRDARGGGPVADALRVPPGDLTRLASQNGGMFPSERVRQIVDGREAHVRAHGTVEMPVWGDAFTRREGLTEGAARERIDAIVQYLASIQARRAH
jgi:mono/diheme cytochrome c family protein